MKALYRLTFLIAVLFTACSNDDDGNKAPIDQLPPATQTGEQTFGCLINGEAFIPKKIGRGRPNAFYQFIDGKYTLGISARNELSPSSAIAIAGIELSSKIQEKQYNLISENIDNFSGVFLQEGGFQLDASTSDENPGTLFITKLDEENNIISGTFEFTVLDNEGKEINITEGRFDLKYTN